MFDPYLTPAALSYLAQLILASLIAGYFSARLLTHRAGRPAHQVLLTGFFICIAFLSLLFFLDASLSPTDRLPALFLQTPVLALGIVFLLRFAYRFPRPFPHRWEARLVLALSLAYLLFEAGYAVYRFYLLSAWGQVSYRLPWADYPMAVGLLWAPVVLLRQAAADHRNVLGASQAPGTLKRAWGAGAAHLLAFLRRLLRPWGQDARAARAMALIYLAVFGISLLNILRSFYHVPPALFQIILSLGAMAALAAFAVVYLNALPETTTFMVRLVGVTVVALLTTLSTVGWLITPGYAAQYRPALPDQRTLRFTPNDAGGYDVSLAPFHFERDLGTNLGLLDSTSPAERATVEGSARLDFTFPFHGHTYEAVYINHDGAIGIGRNVRSPWIYPDYTYRYGSYTPFLFPLLLDLKPEAGGGVYARREADRLIVTWDHVPAFRHPEAVFTFQAVLYASGVFEFSYDGLPDDMTYLPDDEPLTNVWLIGATPGDASESSLQAVSWAPASNRLEPRFQSVALQPMTMRWSSVGGRRSAAQAPEYVDFSSLASGGIIRSGPHGVLHDYYLDFRRHLHALLWPLAYLILGASALALVGFASIFHRNLVRSLDNLLAGVRRVNEGDLQTTMPIHYHDEIGFLTESFNRAVAQQREMISTLEERVAARTAELAAANTQLREEIDQREAAQVQVLLQARALAATEERERLSRELHDGLGQVMAYISVQSQAVQSLLAEGQTDAALANLQRIAQAAQDASSDIRQHILGLRAQASALYDFRQTLQTYVSQFMERYGILTTLSYPADLPSAPFAPTVEENVLRIVQEALTNIRKHAAATQVEVLVAFTDGHAQVIVSDDGVGFRVEDWQGGIAEQRLSAVSSPRSPISGHFGLSMMRERAQMVGGRLEIRSQPGQGTKVLLTLPCSASAPDTQADVQGMRVLLVDDHPLFLDGLRNLLIARGINVIGVARDGLEAQAQARALRPNLIVMDLTMPRCSGLEATRAIKAELPETRIVMLTMSESESDLFEAIKSGASGYLLKSLDAGEFVKHLVGMMRGETPLPSALAARLMAELASGSLPRKGDQQPVPTRGKEIVPAELTPRQWEILKLVADGFTYKEVAAALHLTEEGVKYHMGRILDRMHMTSREEAIAYARQVSRKG